MNRLALCLFAAVTLFVLVVSSILVARSRAARTEGSGPAPSKADLRIKDVELEEESASGRRWRLVADQASVFEGEGRTALRRVRVRVQDRGRSWTIRGDEGDYFKATRDFEVRRNVVLTSDDGVRIETSVLRWKDSEQRLWTDVPVRIYRRGVMIDGTAFSMVTPEERTEVKGRVRATFGPGVEPGS